MSGRKDNMENRGMRVYMSKTKVMTSAERPKQIQKAVRWPCDVCGKVVGSNSIQCRPYLLSEVDTQQM